MLIAGTFLAWFVMTVLVVLSKASRDRREVVSSSRRGQYRKAVLSGGSSDLVEIYKEMVREDSAQTDMLAVLEETGVTPEMILTFRRADEIHPISGTLEFQSYGEEPTARGKGVLLLGRMGLDHAASVADSLLRDEDADVRFAACSALGSVANDAAARSLIQAMSEGLIPHERLIERLGAPWANDEVLRALRESDDPHCRSSLMRSLSLAPDPRALEPLIHYASQGTEEERVSAVRTLGLTGPAEKVIPVLFAALEDDSPAVRAQSARAIGLIHDLNTPEGLELSIVAAERLRGCLSDRDWWVRANTASALRHLGMAGKHQLLDALHDPDRFCRERARESLALLESKAAAAQ